MKCSPEYSLERNHHINTLIGGCDYLGMSPQRSPESTSKRLASSATKQTLTLEKETTKETRACPEHARSGTGGQADFYIPNQT